MPQRDRRSRLLRGLGLGLAATIVFGPMVVPAAARSVVVSAGGPIGPYMGMRGLVPNRSLAKDSKGVVLVSYGGSLGKQYNPVTISQAAIAYYNVIKYGNLSASQEAADKAAMFAQVEWLVTHQDSGGRWLYHFPWGGQPVPWVSAMAQGQAMSALIRANNMKPDVRYTNAIARARTTFERTWNRGGVATWQAVGGKNYLVYEEYMLPYSPHTLNGWMFAMIGLHEDWLYLKDPMAKFDLTSGDRGFAALHKLLPYYDTGKWSFYNLKTLSGSARGTLARKTYHELHIRQLRWFAKTTDVGFFEVYANKFQAYLTACLAAHNCPA